MIIYAVVNGYLKDIAVEDVRSFEKALFDYVDNTYPQIGKSILQTGVLDDETEELLKTAITECSERFLK